MSGAVYHVSVSTLSRSKGRGSAGVTFDYITRRGRFSDRDPVLHLESGHMPDWAQSSPGGVTSHAAGAYWCAADRHERARGRLCKTLTVALPTALLRLFATAIALIVAFVLMATGMPEENTAELVVGVLPSVV